MKNILMLMFLSATTLAICSFTSSSNSFPDLEIEESIVKDLPVGGAYLIFAEKFGGDVTRKQIEGQCELEVRGCAAGSRIFTFTLKVTHAGKTVSFDSKSNALTQEMQKKLRSLQPGDEFRFLKTKAYLPNGKDVVDVHSRKFVVV